MVVRQGFHTVTPYLTSTDLDGLLDFMKRGLGAVETLREKGAAGGAHVELRIGDSMIMVGGIPNGRAGSSAMLFLYVDDPDACYERALAAGASSVAPMMDAPDGRRGGVKDAFGNTWFFGASA